MSTESELDASVRRVLLGILAEGDPYTGIPLVDPSTSLLAPPVLDAIRGPLEEAITDVDEQLATVAPIVSSLDMLVTTGRLSEAEQNATFVGKPSGGANGQVLTKSGSNVVWSDATAEVDVTGIPKVFDGALTDMNVARPAWAGVVIWRVWEGAGLPANFAPGDERDEVEVEAVPVLVWSDAATTAGSLGTTETGGLTWTVFGGYTYAKSGGKFVCTAAGATLGSQYVNDGLTDCRFTVTISAKGTGGAATIYPRYQNGSNHLALVSVSTGDNTYRLRSRIAGTQADIATLTGFVMTDGDVVEFTTKADGTLVIKINTVTAYTGTVSTFATETQRGFGTRTNTGATTVTFDDASVYTLVA